MPLGSSSDAPVIRPGPKTPSKRGRDGPTTGLSLSGSRGGGRFASSCPAKFVSHLCFYLQRISQRFVSAINKKSPGKPGLFESLILAF